MTWSHLNRDETTQILLKYGVQEVPLRKCQRMQAEIKRMSRTYDIKPTWDRQGVHKSKRGAAQFEQKLYTDDNFDKLRQYGGFHVDIGTTWQVYSIIYALTRMWMTPCRSARQVQCIVKLQKLKRKLIYLLLTNQNIIQNGTNTYGAVELSVIEGSTLSTSAVDDARSIYGNCSSIKLKRY